MGNTPTRDIYQIKITLIGTEPIIWRQMLVQSGIFLSNFHEILQHVMGWTDSHLHQFIVGKTFYRIPYDDLDFGDEFDDRDETEHRLDQLLISEKDIILYEYDFGDCWRHEIILEKIFPYSKEMVTPYCIQGERACPPEDCGGVYGYQNLLEIIKDQNHPENEEMLVWLGEGFDPAVFNIKESNVMLSLLSKRRIK